jgi:hypothetical protein
MQFLLKLVFIVERVRFLANRCSVKKFWLSTVSDLITDFASHRTHPSNLNLKESKNCRTHINTHVSQNLKYDNAPMRINGILTLCFVWWLRTRTVQLKYQYSEVSFIVYHVKKNKHRCFSPPANYTDRTTAACRQS